MLESMNNPLPNAAGRRTGPEMGGWFVRKNDREPELHAGAVFRNVRHGNLVETARILAVTQDGQGIPHVRFDVTLDSPGKIRLVEGRRMLCVASFTQQFPERVSA